MRALSFLTVAAAAALAGCGGTNAAAPAPVPAPSSTAAPSARPSAAPTAAPTNAPTVAPTVAPTISPTVAPTSVPTVAPTIAPTVAPTVAPTAQPQVINVGFALSGVVDPTFGPVYYYGLTQSQASVLRLRSGSQVVFTNVDTVAHTASGLGASFPAAFNNSNGANTQAGGTFDASNWSSGTLGAGRSSQVLTIGPPGTYYFGCAFHYRGVPAAGNGSMGDVLVSQ